MGTGFQTVFDLTRQPNLIHPAYWFYALFAFAGCIFGAIGWLAVKRRWRRRRSLSLFAAAWVAICTYCTIIDFRDTEAIRSAVVTGHVETAHGCLDYFRPGSPEGSKTTAGNEEWSIDGQVFSYGAGEVRPGYHLVSTAGGPVRADSRVWASFVVSPAYGRREIVKLAVAPHACPTARQISMFDQP